MMCRSWPIADVPPCPLTRLLSGVKRNGEFMSTRPSAPAAPLGVVQGAGEPPERAAPEVGGIEERPGSTTRSGEPFRCRARQIGTPKRRERYDVQAPVGRMYAAGPRAPSRHEAARRVLFAFRGEEPPGPKPARELGKHRRRCLQEFVPSSRGLSRVSSPSAAGSGVRDRCC